ncbi:CsgG/HfaB family protein [Diaphorobacter caeni]|uniref:CsgG/HfaB family protein n=1 Tax=Diaphorobacter caeni TaxID=2784387 RepID=UPI00188EA997|nr:CsgG/HfaB family protein [Diaphorobacter caeni]MBF5006565.1 hypothetical protein [Diaphorobacter caeni]
MRKLLGLTLTMAAVVLLSACNKAEPEQAAKPPAAEKNVAAPVPDVGRLTTVQTSAQGFGATAGEAVAEAMKLAILQVNGAAVESASVSAKYGLDVSLGRESASLRANEFVELVRQKSGGVIQNFKLVELREPGLITDKQFKATIEAQIAKFEPSADMQKIKVVVGQIRFDSPNLPMGDRSVSSAEVGATLRQRISDALVQTGRFAVLDREFSPDIQNELEMISSGQAPSAELAKLSQAASADLVWSARVSNLAYNRHARQLKTSDRELVSYSGGWAMTQKLVNVATRQVTASDALRGMAPSTAPTTLGSGVDGSRVLEDMNTDIVNQVITSVMRRTFPVTVVSRDGVNVVLSQGGQLMKEGTRYAMVNMGAEMKDPQTGQSLGRVESPCCDLVIDRVTPNLSYGRLENVRGQLDQLPAGALQVREQLKDVATAKGAMGDAQSAPAAAAPAAPAPARRQTRAPQQEESAAPASVKANDDKW